MNLKYENLINDLSIRDSCPPINLKEIERVAYRWVLSPIENDSNFLPNYAFDKVKNNIENYNNGNFGNEEKCLRCSLSMYETLTAAKINHNKLPKKLKEKLGYTHIAQGKIEKKDGIGTEINCVGHFSFFEQKNTDFKGIFSIVESLENQNQ